jgi:penicillin-binding protein 2
VVEDVADTHWDAIHGGMVEVLHGARGSARAAAAGIDYKMAGKSGTVQLVAIAKDAKYDREAIHERHRDHALFVAFAPLEDPQIAVALILENGEGGSSQAAPVVRKVTDAYLRGKYLLPEATQLPVSSAPLAQVTSPPSALANQ